MEEMNLQEIKRLEEEEKRLLEEEKRLLEEEEESSKRLGLELMAQVLPWL